MAILTVLEYPDKRLRNRALPVSPPDEAIRKIIDDMFETMYDHNAVGLAAPQVNIQQRIIVMDCSDQRDTPICIINPEIIIQNGMQCEFEGCLSFPDVFDKIERSASLTVRGLDKDGQALELNADGLLATCIEHETEHLDGTLFIDHLSKLKQDRLLRKLQKFRARAE